MIREAGFNKELNEKRSIIQGSRGPLASHLKNQYRGKEGDLPSEVKK